MTVLTLLAAVLGALVTHAAYRSGQRAGMARALGALQLLRSQLADLDAERAALIAAAEARMEAR